MLARNLVQTRLSVIYHYIFLIETSSKIKKIFLALPSELFLKDVCIGGLNKSDGAAPQLSPVRFLSVVSPLISLLSRLLKLILALQLLARVKLHFY